LTKEAQQYVQQGFKLVMQEKVDKGLLGGFILEFEDRLVDMSVKKKLEEFNNLVSERMHGGVSHFGGVGTSWWT
jgi:F-type H+-transporting ATPase subunit O